MLGASPGIAGEIIERVEDSARNRGRDGDGERARACVRRGWEVVSPLRLGGAGKDNAGARGALLDAVGQHGQRHFEGVGFFVGESFGGEDGAACEARLDAPVDIALTLCGDVDLLRLAADDINTLHVELECYVFGGFEVVVGNDTQDSLIALAEEARGGEADDEVFADEDAGDCASSLAIVGHGADGGAPGGERVREVELDARVAVGTCVHIGIPIGRVRKGLAHLGNNEVGARLYLRQSRMVDAVGQQREERTPGARLAGEEEVEGGLRTQLDEAAGIKGVDDVTRVVGTDRVKRLVNCAEAEVSFNRFVV